MADSRSSPAIGWIAVAALAAALGVIGAWLLFTTFMIYDDEGYVLLSLKNYSVHGGLYDRVYTQYGPFPYVLYDALHRLLDFEFSNTSGRWIAFASWIGTAGVCAALVGRMTRSALWAGFTLTVVFTHLWIMVQEPAHPGGLLALLVALATWASAEAWRAGRTTWFAVVTGIFGAALVLTKINVGLFFLTAAGIWLAINSRSIASARWLTWLAASGCALLPFVLMRTLIEAQWVRMFALLFTGGSLSILLTAGAATGRVATVRSWFWFALASGTVALAICAVALGRGSSFGGLVDGIVLGPLKHPGAYFFAPKWRTGSGLLALASLGVAVWSIRARQGFSARFDEFIAWTRILVAGAFFLSLLRLIPVSQAAWAACYGVSFAWVFAIPLRRSPPTAGIASWVALVFIFQFLHAYPVAGSQLSWGTYLWVPLLALGVHDALPVVRTRLGQTGIWASRAGAVAIASLTLLMAVRFGRIGWDRYSTSEPLGLTGAENLRLPHDFTSALRIVDENLRVHADLLFSLPGLYSANLWTDLPPPTLANVTHWFSLLSPSQQEEIIQRLATSPRSALLVQRQLLDHLTRSNFSATSPLHDWLMANFERSFTVDGYEVWVCRGRKIAPFSTAQYVSVEQNNITLTLTLQEVGAPISRIEFCNVSAARAPALILDDRNTSVSVAPCGLDGQPIGTFAPAQFPLQLEQPSLVTLRFLATGAPIPVNRSLLVLRDNAGAIVREVRIVVP